MYKTKHSTLPGGGKWGLPLMAYTVRFRSKSVRYFKRFGIQEMTYLEG